VERSAVLEEPRKFQLAQHAFVRGISDASAGGVRKGQRASMKSTK
jgi:hypothetical protein